MARFLSGSLLVSRVRRRDLFFVLPRGYAAEMADQATGMLSGWLREERFRAAVPHCVGKVFDCGCGVGKLAQYIAPECYLGYDIDEESVRDAQRDFPLHSFTSQMPAEGVFESIVALALIEHMPEPRGFVNDLSRLLAPNGQIVLTSPHPHLEWTHDLGAKVGLFSVEAADEHHELFDRRGFANLARGSGLDLVHYRRFLFGANQLAILRKR